MPGRHDLAGRVLALAGFHVVLHQNLDVNHAAVFGGAYAHRVCHVFLLLQFGNLDPGRGVSRRSRPA
jgi:xylose isomerase